VVPLHGVGVPGQKGARRCLTDAPLRLISRHAAESGRHGTIKIYGSDNPAADGSTWPRQ
jgi:hypothetical protein